jgi:hypothetical protein
MKRPELDLKTELKGLNSSHSTSKLLKAPIIPLSRDLQDTKHVPRLINKSVERCRIIKLAECRRNICLPFHSGVIEFKLIIEPTAAGNFSICRNCGIQFWSLVYVCGWMGMSGGRQRALSLKHLATRTTHTCTPARVSGSQIVFPQSAKNENTKIHNSALLTLTRLFVSAQTKFQLLTRAA